jgi:hypothetical protein
MNDFEVQRFPVEAHSSASLLKVLSMSAKFII